MLELLHVLLLGNVFSWDYSRMTYMNSHSRGRNCLTYFKHTLTLRARTLPYTNSLTCWAPVDAVVDVYVLVLPCVGGRGGLVRVVARQPDPHCHFLCKFCPPPPPLTSPLSCTACRVSMSPRLECPLPSRCMRMRVSRTFICLQQTHGAIGTCSIDPQTQPLYDGDERYLAGHGTVDELHG